MNVSCAILGHTPKQSADGKVGEIQWVCSRCGRTLGPVKVRFRDRIDTK
jgi:hypothetical protein